MEFPSKFTLAESQDDNTTSFTRVKQLSNDNEKSKPKQKPLNKQTQPKKPPHHQTLEKCVYQRFVVSALLGNERKILK